MFATIWCISCGEKKENLVGHLNWYLRNVTILSLAAEDGKRVYSIEVNIF
jgi:hypothetical protein